MSRFGLYTLALAASLVSACATPAIAKHGGPQVVTLVQTGTIRVHNESSFPMVIRIDGAHVGKVAAHSVLVLASAPAGNRTLVASYPGKQNVPTRSMSVFVAPGSVAQAVIPEVAGHVLVRNPNALPVAVLVDGSLRGRAAAHGTLRVSNLRPGDHRVTLQAPNGATSTTVVRVAPAQVSSVTLAVFTGSLKVNNGNPFPVKVLVDGHLRGKVAPFSSGMFQGLAAGSHRVEVIGKHGLHLAHTTTIAAADVAHWTVSSPTAKYVKPAGPAAVVLPCPMVQPTKVVKMAPKPTKKGYLKKSGYAQKGKKGKTFKKAGTLVYVSK